jgi:hypothetical protein
LTTLDRDTQARYPDAPSLAVRPTLQNLRRALARLDPEFARDLARGATPVLFLTFSGHGSTTATGELALALEDGGLTRSILYDELLAPRADVQVHLIIDACHAGGVVGVRGAFDREVEAELVDAHAAAPAGLLEHGALNRFPNVGALVAASVDQKTHEWSRLQSGVFTHELLSALVGAADVNGDARVEYSEVEAFIAAANRTLPDPNAAPRVIAHPPAADARAVLMATDQLKDTYLLRGRPGSLGRFDVVLENGVRWLSVHAEENTQLSLALPQGMTKYVQTETSESELPARSERPVAVSSLHFSERGVRARGRLDDSYSRELFRSAYGPLYYRGYVDKAGLPSVPFAKPARLDAGAQAPSRRRRAAVALGSSALALTLAAGVSGVISWRAKREFEDTDLMRKSLTSRDEYRQYGLVAASCGALAAVGWIAGTWLWVSGKPAAAAQAFAPGGVRW